MLLKRSILTAVAFAVLGAVAAASTSPVIVTAGTAKWQSVPGFKGWQMAKVVGDPSKAGAYYAYLLKAPTGGTAAPHFHKMTENVTVISGTMMFGLGDTMNTAKMMTYGPGTVISIPAGAHHYAMAKEASLLEVSGIGPDVTTMLHK